MVILRARKYQTSKQWNAHPTYPHQIKLPFELRDPTIKIEGGILQALLAIFPSTTNIAINPCLAYINFTVESLPSVQLPLSILPCEYRLRSRSSVLTTEPLVINDLSKFPRHSPLETSRFACCRKIYVNSIC